MPAWTQATKTQEVDADYDPSFLRHIFPRIEWATLREAAEVMGTPHALRTHDLSTWGSLVNQSCFVHGERRSKLGGWTGQRLLEADVCSNCTLSCAVIYCRSRYGRRHSNQSMVRQGGAPLLLCTIGTITRSLLCYERQR